MKLLLDTNVIIDVISKREGHAYSLIVMQYCEHYANGMVLASAITDIIYILRKFVAPETVRDSLQTLLKIVDIVDVTKNDIHAAFASPLRDYEDALQVVCAVRMEVDYIITNNTRDFRDSSVAVMTPQEFSVLIELGSRNPRHE